MQPDEFAQLLRTELSRLLRETPKSGPRSQDTASFATETIRRLQ
jgi:hypothetical protein